MVIPLALLAKTIEGAEARAANEVKIRARIAAGELPLDILGIRNTIETLGIERFDLKYDSGTSHEDNLRSIELFGTEVIPRVRALMGE